MSLKMAATSCKRARKNSSESLSAMEKLPNEILFHIFEYLNFNPWDMRHLSEVCQRFHQLLKYQFHDLSNMNVHYEDLKKCIVQNVEYISLQGTYIDTEQTYNCSQCNYSTTENVKFVKHMKKSMILLILNILHNYNHWNKWENPLSNT